MEPHSYKVMERQVDHLILTNVNGKCGIIILCYMVPL